MRGRRTPLFLFAAAAVAAQIAWAPAASLAQGSVIADCNAHGRLTQQYSVGQLRTALNTMPADVKEYTNCYDLAERALVAQLGSSKVNGSTPAGSGGSFFSTPVIVVVAVLILAAGGFGALALRRRSA